VIVFAFTFGAYEVPLAAGASHPQALPVLAYKTYTDVDLAARPEAMAMAVVIASCRADDLGLSARHAGEGAVMSGMRRVRSSSCRGRC
jgi:putative spermidine/putrescine transport system permease protein